MTTPAEISAVMSGAMDAENQRRELASQLPGHGAPLPLPQPVSAAGVGLSDVLMPVVGEGYDITPPVATAVSKAYGPERPVYSADEVGGVSFVAGRQEAPVRVLAVHRSAPSAGVVFATPSRPPGLLSRLLGRLRRGR
jgi:hypothetical protein